MYISNKHIISAFAIILAIILLTCVIVLAKYSELTNKGLDLLLASRSASQDSGVEFNFNTPSSVDMGENIIWQLGLNNTAAERRSVRVVISAAAASYAGTNLAELKKIDEVIELKPSESKIVEMVIEEATYTSWTHVTDVFSFSVGAKVIGINDFFFERQTTVLVNPGITVSLSPSFEIVLNESVDCEATFVNPLSVNLNDVSFSFSVGSDLKVNGKLDWQTDSTTLIPGESFTRQVKITGLEPGEQLISVRLNSDKLSQVSGYAYLKVKAPCLDNDEDGYGSLASEFCLYPLWDCDDMNPQVNPGQEEVLGNILDDNCDGLIDTKGP